MEARSSRRSCGRASIRPGSREGAPPGEGWAAGVLWALQGTNVPGMADFPAGLLGRPGQGRGPEGPGWGRQEAGACLLAIDRHQYRCAPGSSALLGEVEELTRLRWGWDTEEAASFL